MKWARCHVRTAQTAVPGLCWSAIIGGESGPKQVAGGMETKRLGWMAHDLQ